MFPVSTEPCPTGFMPAHYLGSCYHAIVDRMLIGEAQLACPEIHPKARLVSIETNTEHDFLRRFAELLNLQNGALLIC